MPDQLSLADLITILGPRIGLRCVHGADGASSRDLREPNNGEMSMAGHLNLVRPNLIQVVGTVESRYIESLAAAEHLKLIYDLAAGGTIAVIFAEDTCPFETLPTDSVHPMPVVLCTCSDSHEVISLIRYFLQQRLAQSVVRHGVFMEILGAGVLISGDSSVGKSEVALELISRGHRLIADDAPEFARIAPDIIRGSCPPLLRDLLEVRGLGVLNVRAMYGDSALKRGKYLRLVIELRDRNQPSLVPDDRLNGSRGEVEVLGLRIPMVSLPVAPGRNIAVMIEAAVRTHLLRLQGYNAGEDLRARQRRQMGLQNESPPPSELSAFSILGNPF